MLQVPPDGLVAPAADPCWFGLVRRFGSSGHVTHDPGLSWEGGRPRKALSYALRMARNDNGRDENCVAELRTVILAH